MLQVGNLLVVVQADDFEGGVGEDGRDAAGIDGWTYVPTRGYIIYILAAEMLIEGEDVLVVVAGVSPERDAATNLQAVTIAYFLYCAAKHGSHAVSATEPGVLHVHTKVCCHHIEPVLDKTLEKSRCVRVGGL